MTGICPKFNYFFQFIFMYLNVVQVGGEKMYDKARRGEMVELSPRRISIFDFAIERSLEDRYWQPTDFLHICFVNV